MTVRKDEQIVNKYMKKIRKDNAQCFNIALKRKGGSEKKKEKKVLQHGVFVFGHPSKY